MPDRKKCPGHEGHAPAERGREEAEPAAGHDQPDTAPLFRKLPPSDAPFVASARMEASGGSKRVDHL